MKQLVDTSNKIAELEGLRALLVLGVIVYHVFSITGVTIPRLLNWSEAVSVFFILSGFVIAMILHHSKESYRSFIIRRFFRLFPAYAVCVLVGGFLTVNGLMPKTYEDHSLGWHVLLHATMLHGVLPVNLLPGAESAFLNPAWLITVEWQFYLLIPAFFILLRNKPVIAWLLLFTVVAVSRRILMPALNLGGGSLFDHLQYFLYGIISYFMYQWALRNSEKIKLFALLLPYAAPVLLASLVSVIPNIGLFIWGFFFGATVSIRTGHALMPTKILIKFLRSKPLTWLGSFSFALYLAHEPVLWLSIHVVKSIFPHIAVMDTALLVGWITIPVSIAAGHFLHVGVEIPCIRIGKKLAIKHVSRLDVVQT
ncbi:MAG: acyltransferase family protein [Arenimonas sp.]